MKKELLTFSHEGDIKHYAHFFFSVMIPVIIYHLKYPNYLLNLQINIGNMFNIMKTLLPNKITNNYIYDESRAYENYMLKSKLNCIKPNNIVILDGFDILMQYNYEKFNPKLIINKIELDELMHKYNCYNYKKNEEYKLTEKEKSNRKIMLYTYLCKKLQKYQPIIIKFFDKFPKPSKDYKPIIFIERLKPDKLELNLYKSTGGQRRFINNYENIKTVLSDKYKDKIEFVTLESLNIIEQYYTFHNAKIVIGQHGAGLCNIYFCNKKTKLIEITPVWNDNNNWFKNLADLCKIKYVAIHQPYMTEKQANIFFDNVNLKDKSNIKLLYNSTKFKNTMYYHDPVEVQIAKNSGDVDVKEIIKNINSKNNV